MKNVWYSSGVMGLDLKLFNDRKQVSQIRYLQN